MNKSLQRIANTVVLYSYHLQNEGLLNGRMGIVLFLYRYADYSGCKYYREFSDKLLDYVLASSCRIPVDFENGLSGIGWAVNYLIQGGLVDGDPNDVLQDVDKKVFSSYSCNPRTSIFGQGIYLIERLKDNQPNVDLKKRVIECLEFCERRVKEYRDVPSLYHVNSILFFLHRIESVLPDNKVVNSIVESLPDRLQSAFRDRFFDDADLYIIRRMLTEIGTKQKTGWDSVLSIQIPELSRDFDLETMIRISWQEELYFGNSTLKDLLLKDITHFVDRKLESLTISDFLFTKGLAGLGNMIMSSNTFDII